MLLDGTASLLGIPTSLYRASGGLRGHALRLCPMEHRAIAGGSFDIASMGKQPHNPRPMDPEIHRSDGAVWWRPRTPGSPGAPVWYVEHSAHSVARLATCACVCIQYICSLSSSVVSGCRHLGMSRHLVDPDFGGISGNASRRCIGGCFAVRLCVCMQCIP